MILPEELSTFEYYKQKLPLYLQNSTSFQEHFKIWYDIMMGDSSQNINGVVPSLEEMLALFDIFSIDYKSNTSYDMLDKIGSIFGVTRKFKSGAYTFDLHDDTFSKLIKARIVRNACEGTRQQIQALYEELFNDANEQGDRIYQVILQRDGIANVTIYLASLEPEDSASDLQRLFLAGELRVESMGISYSERITTVNNLLIWDSEETDHMWFDFASTSEQPGGIWL